MPPRDLAVRLRASYESLVSTVSDWSLLCKNIICYEHPEPNNIHCHLLLTDVYCTDQTLKNTMWSHGVSCKGSGQLSFKDSFKDPKTKLKMEINHETIPKYITYMSKGKYEPKFNRGYEDTHSIYKGNWVVYHNNSPSELLRLEFEQFVQGLLGGKHYTCVKDVCSAAHVFLMNKYRSHTPQMRKAQSTLIDDYCYYQKIEKEYRLPYQPF